MRQNKHVHTFFNLGKSKQFKLTNKVKYICTYSVSEEFELTKSLSDEHLHTTQYHGSSLQPPAVAGCSVVYKPRQKQVHTPQGRPKKSTQIVTT